MINMKCPFCQQELDCMGKYTDGSSKWLCNKCGLFGDKKLFDEIIRTRKELEQSETCCSAWETQALDYKAENIALSGDLERTRKALDVAFDALKLFCGEDVAYYAQSKIDARDARTALEQITALEQKDK